MLHDREEDKAADLITKFLKEYVKKVNIKNKIIQYINKSKHFNRCRLQLEYSIDRPKKDQVKRQFEQNEKVTPGQVFHWNSQ